MKLAVLLLSVTDKPRVTTYNRAWVHEVVTHVAGYWLDQTSGRVNMQFRVFDWFQLPLTSDGWNNLFFGAGPVVKPMVEKGLGVDLSGYDHFALVIDKFDAASAAVSPDHPAYVHMGGQSFDPALLAHEMGHFFGASHANLDTPAGPREYDDRFCVMGREGEKYGFIEPDLNLPRPDGSMSITLSDSGPGMSAPSLRACGWLDLAQHGIDVSEALRSGVRRTTVELPALRGAPAGAHRVVAWADGVVTGQRLFVEYRSTEDDGWDRGMPHEGPGWVVAHLTGPEDRSRMSLQVGAVAARPGQAFVTSQGSVRISVGASSFETVNVTLEVMAAVPVDRAAPTAVSWGKDRIDVFARGLEKAAYHKAWAQRWHPGQAEWEAIGGGFNTGVSVASWGPDRLDAFGVGLDQAMWHKAWAQAWHPSQAAWEPLGGKFVSPPAVESWGPDRLDVFALGTDRAVWHKAWAQQWSPSQNDWESLGGKFLHAPAVASWGPGRLDIFGVGLDKAMFHKAWANGWSPSPTEWEFLGGGFTSAPTVCSWGPDRLDIFALGLDGSLWHKAWAQTWLPGQTDWEPLGGKFLAPPAVASWAPGRLDVFGVGLDGQMYHRAFDGAWHSWEQLGGIFASPPTVVSWGKDRLDIFAIGKDRQLWHKAWAQQWFPSATDWEALGGLFV